MMTRSHLFHDPEIARLAEAAKGLVMQVDPATLTDPGVPPIPHSQSVPPNPGPGNQPPAPPAQPPTTLMWSAEEVEEIRREERNKLNSQLAKAREEAKELKAFKDAQERKEAEAQAAAAEAARQKQLDDADAKTAVEMARQEFQQRLDALERERATDRAQFAKEQEYLQLQAYISQALATNSEAILPEFNDPVFVTGNTVDEVNVSIQRLVAKTAQTLAGFQGGQAAATRAAPGISPNAPAMGPEAFIGSTRTPTPEELAAMPMDQYAQYRQQLAPGRAGTGSGRGIFG
jgi:hypothetical protein